MSDFNVFTAPRNELQKRLVELEAEKQKLSEQLDAANYVIQTLNRVIAGDVG